MDDRFTTTVLKGFTQRLAALLAERGMSQNQLALLLGISRSTVTGWLRYGKLPDAGLLAALCRELKCSSDWLLGLPTQVEKANSSGTIRWVEQIPPYVGDFQREQLGYGVKLFNLIVGENRAADEMANAYNGQTVRFALQSALRSGAIRLSHVARSEALEDQIKRRYPFLKDVVVAHSPENYDDTIIRTELVAFLAAIHVLTRVIRESAVGLGSGYTVLRLCEQSIPSVDQFSGTRWIPLLAFAPDNTGDYSANYLARLMSVRHPGSQALYLPHPSECSTKRMKALQAETLRQMKNVQSIFVSVSGVDRRNRAGSSHLLAEFRSADYAVEAPTLRTAYATLDDKAAFGAELLRYLLDTDGRIISRDETVGSQIDLDILRYNSDMIGRVCIVAARQYKAKAVLTCIQNRLANVIVIDSEIANYLI
jgi:DNA-binding transcriptional regulator LsrR (DeoR family)